MKQINNIILPFKQYLNLWMQIDKAPDKIVRDDGLVLDFRDKESLKKTLRTMASDEYLSQKYLTLDKLTVNDIVYIIGIFLYNEVSGVEYNGDKNLDSIKYVGLYQFFNSILFTEYDYRVTSPRYLLTVLDLVHTDINYVEKLGKTQIEIFSSVGLTRTQNQDYCDWIIEENYTLLIVADGMGGGEDGDVASDLATNICLKQIKENYKKSLNIQEMDSLLRDTLISANDEVLKYAIENEIKKIGTTLSLVFINDEELFIAHLGDSRVYMQEGSDFKQLTEDHSYPEILYKLGKITEEEKKDYKKNLLVYFIGKKDLKRENIYIVKKDIDIQKDLKLFMCSDGIWENVESTHFEDEFENLNSYIMQTTPQDNVSYIRYTRDGTRE